MAINVNSRFGFRFLGDLKNKIYHDLYNEKHDCKVNQIISSGNGVRFEPDNQQQAEKEGFVRCENCLK